MQELHEVIIRNLKGTGENNDFHNMLPSLNFKVTKSKKMRPMGYGGHDKSMQQFSRKALRKETIRETWAVMEGEYRNGEKNTRI
jgi:hypothetical protein